MLSFSANGGMNVTGLRLVDLNNQSAKAFLKSWQGHETAKWSGTGHNRIPVSSGQCGHRSVWYPRDGRPHAEN